MTAFVPTGCPETDPTPLFEHFRGSYATELLTAAVAHFDVFGKLGREPLAPQQLAAELGLAERPCSVLTTALRAMRLLDRDAGGRFCLTLLAREHLVPGGPFDVGDYIGLAAQSPGVRELVTRLQTNRPAGSGDGGQGTAFVYRSGVPSAMDGAELARHFTLALAGRAKNVAPRFAEQAGLSAARTLLDVGGGTGIYSLACLRQYPQLRAVVLDRPEVLKVAAEFAEAVGLTDRLEFAAGDMFGPEPWPAADAVLLSNVLHDWDVPECRQLVARAADALPPGGRLLIHDVFLNDELDGPLPLALYSTALFTLTEGRAYSAAEYREWMGEAGLLPEDLRPTLVHCGVLSGVKR